MKLAKNLDIAAQFMSAIDEKMDGMRLKDGMPAKVSGALLHLSLEHFGASVVLLKSGLSASAAALIRLQYEALIRGIYFYHCASEIEAEKFFSGKEPPRIKEMIVALEKEPGFSSGMFSRVHGREWSAMNSFTHGGAAQVQRRYSESDLMNNYTEADSLNILEAAKKLAIIAASHAAISCGALDLAEELKNEFNKVTGEL